MWSTKAETDASFNYGIEKTLSTVVHQLQESGQSSIGVVFATHNSLSIDLAIRLLKKHGMASHKEGEGRLVVSKKTAAALLSLNSMVCWP